MKSMLRFISLALASAALMALPGQAIAGGGDWGGGHDGRGYGNRIRDVRVCFDEDDGLIRVGFRAPGFQGRRYYDDDIFVALELAGDASCVDHDRWGKSSYSSAYVDGLVSDEVCAERTYGNRFEAVFDAFDYDGHFDVCGDRGYGDFDLQELVVDIEGRAFAFDAYDIESCGDDGPDDWWN